MQTSPTVHFIQVYQITLSQVCTYLGTSKKSRLDSLYILIFLFQTILMKDSQHLTADTSTRAQPVSSTSAKSPRAPLPQVSPMSSSKTCAEVETQRDTEGMLDIRSLREKSKNLDLPLISALCNDRSLIKQTNVLVSPTTTLTPAESATLTHTAKKKLFASFLSSGSSKNSSCLASNKLKYPVSNPIFKSSRKSLSVSESSDKKVSS